MNQGPETNVQQKISGQCNVTTRIEQMQDKKNINWAAKKYY